MTLTVLCVSEYGAHAAPFLSRLEQFADDIDADCFIEYDGTGFRCLEDILDAAVAECDDGYILRLDDDELPTPQMVEWMRDRRFEEADHWAFPRLNLYPDDRHYLASIWPDLQTRLSIKAMSGGRTRVHAGSPFGTGRVAPVAIEHHKFLVRSLAERLALVERYDAILPGAGTGFRVFSVPESEPVFWLPVEQATVAA